ncbi:cupin domain-containing protein [Fusibacter sp. JL298sf-3]
MQNITHQMIEEIVKKVVAEQMGSAVDQNRHVDPSGVISVKAGNIVAEPFDTGKAGDKVGLTDLFSLGESPRLGAGMMELDHTTFDWTLNYDEVDYVIEGTLEIIIDGRKVVGHAGDVIMIPKGSTIQFSTPDFCRFLYVVYPANWAEQA